jgi:subtilisin family serine protease
MFLIKHIFFFFQTTTGPDATCVDNFDGTSAATPQVSGIIALTLEAKYVLHLLHM